MATQGIALAALLPYLLGLPKLTFNHTAEYNAGIMLTLIPNAYTHMVCHFVKPQKKIK
tara:strand:- start:898 stop:1071 length:174 start_codon:yes stop_codon:yes gene_type:complete